MIEFARYEDITQLIKIWEICFGDSQEYIKFFFQNNFSRIKIPILRNKKQEVICMLSLFPTLIRIKNKIFRASYVYAVATLPAYQSQGLAGKLLDQACLYCKGQNQQLTLLVPQSPGLHEYYNRHGFTQFSVLMLSTIANKGFYPVNHISFTECSETDFVKLRSAFQDKKENVLIHDEKMLRYIYKEAFFTNGKIVKIFHGKNIDYAIVYQNEKSLFIKETSLPKESLSKFFSLSFKQFDLEKILLQTDLPLQNSDKTPFARIRMLDKNIKIPNGFSKEGERLSCGFADNIYINLMLD